jgi:glycosyltransferase involved in cell wall biosynthesis
MNAVSRSESSAQRRVVYVTYDGLEEPLGKSQVLPYLRGLADRGHTFDVLSFEKPGAALRMREEIAPRIFVTSLRYHRTPTVPATAFDMLQGLGTAAMLATLRSADLIHVRSYVPGTMALPIVLAARKPLLLDTRGLWADEKVEAGSWQKHGRLYKGAKVVERLLLRSADAITVLTHALQRFLRREYPYRSEVRAPIHVIPTCTDLSSFRPDVAPDPALRQELADCSTLAYVGSFGGRYLATDMARFYLAWRRAVGRPSRLLVVSRDEPREIVSVLKERGLGSELVVRTADRKDVPSMIRCADAGVCFILPLFSTTGSAPTKLGEFLGCGVPVVANVFGDVSSLLHESGAGVAISDLSEAALDAAARELVVLSSQPATRARARKLAESWFSLERGIAAYGELYASLPSIHGHAVAPADRGWI